MVPPTLTLLLTQSGKINLYGGDRGRSADKFSEGNVFFDFVEGNVYMDDMDFAEGNVYLDDQPICDDQWGTEEATVACRWGLHFEVVFEFLVVKVVITRMLGYTEGHPRQRSVYGIAREDEEFGLTEVRFKQDRNLSDDALV